MSGRPKGYVREERNGTLYCTACDEWLPIKQFKPDKNRPSALFRASMCNRCLYSRYTRPEAERKLALVHVYKLEHGCADCGYSKHPAALEFDHRPGENKLFNIGEKVGSYSLEKIWAEVAKCDVVCANCHAIRTVERRQRVGE
jgi:hypothetical protein